MFRRTMQSDVYGKIIYKEACWLIKENIDLFINGKIQAIKGEIDVFSVVYEEKKLGLLDEEHIQFYDENPYLVNEEKASAIEAFQKHMFQKLVLTSKREICNLIEEVALQKREECLEGQTEKSFAKIVGREKAHSCFKAKTRAEKLSSLVLKRMRIMQDHIEITCKCDWFRPSGGFIIYEDGGVEMRYIDSI